MADQQTTLAADGLRVVFFRTGDRYAHRIEVQDGATQRWSTAYESLEGAPDDDWPPSPPLQQLHVEERRKGPVVLLIGMAGRTHWSAAVEVAADGRSIAFDIAARVQSAPVRLGSEYGLAPLVPERGEGPGARGIRIVPPATLESGDNGQRIVPKLITTTPTTISWRYVIQHCDKA